MELKQINSCVPLKYKVQPHITNIIFIASTSCEKDEQSIIHFYNIFYTFRKHFPYSLLILLIDTRFPKLLSEDGHKVRFKRPGFHDFSILPNSESTFIIKLDKLTSKMNVKCYTYMNLCVILRSGWLFSLCQQLKAHFSSRSACFILRPSDSFSSP